MRTAQEWALGVRVPEDPLELRSRGITTAGVIVFGGSVGQPGNHYT